LEPISVKKERVKLTPEQMFDVHVETSTAGAPIKSILQRYGLKPWELAEIRKKVRAGAVQALATKGKPGRPQQGIPLEEHHKLNRELQNTKDALVTVAHELALLKKRVS